MELLVTFVANLSEPYTLDPMSNVPSPQSEDSKPGS